MTHQSSNPGIFKQIRHVPSWPTLTPRGFSLQSADCALLNFLRVKQRAKADDLWCVDALPLSQVVLSQHPSQPNVNMVICVEPGRAALVWPMMDRGEVSLLLTLAFSHPDRVLLIRMF